MPGALTLATSTREKLQSISQVLQETELEYLNLRQQLLNINTEVSESLQKVENNGGVDYQELIRENHLNSLKVIIFITIILPFLFCFVFLKNNQIWNIIG